jgi:hypothetical protein
MIKSLQISKGFTAWLPLWYRQTLGHCIVCPFSLCGFWLSLWYLQTFDHCIVCPSSMYGLWYYSFDIFKLFSHPLIKNNSLWVHCMLNFSNTTYYHSLCNVKLDISISQTRKRHCFFLLFRFYFYDYWIGFGIFDFCWQCCMLLTVLYFVECCILPTVLYFVDSVVFHRQCCILSTVLYFVDSVVFCRQRCISSTVLYFVDSVVFCRQCCLLCFSFYYMYNLPMNQCKSGDRDCWHLLC